MKITTRVGGIIRRRGRTRDDIPYRSMSPRWDMDVTITREVTYDTDDAVESFINEHDIPMWYAFKIDHPDYDYIEITRGNWI